MRSARTAGWLGALVLGLLTVSRTAEGEPAKTETSIDFARQIRPILSENCFLCHGPDDKQRKAKLRLDTKEGAFTELRNGGFAVVPGDPKKSILLQRILSKNPKERMPPAKTNKHLKPHQIELLTKWVEQGAAWSKHWAFLPPQRPQLPKTIGGTWARNAIDHFILARLEAEGLKPSPEADRARLIRRVTLDLTGL